MIIKKRIAEARSGKSNGTFGWNSSPVVNKQIIHQALTFSIPANHWRVDIVISSGNARTYIAVSRGES